MVKYSNHELDSMFHALADPTRREIIRLLAPNPKSVSEVAKPFNISLPAITKHVKVLEKADIITREKVGRQNFLSLNPESLKEMSRYLTFYKDFWNTQFDSLEKYMDKKRNELKGGDKHE